MTAEIFFGDDPDFNRFVKEKIDQINKYLKETGRHELFERDIALILKREAFAISALSVDPYDKKIWYTRVYPDPKENTPENVAKDIMMNMAPWCDEHGYIHFGDVYVFLQHGGEDGNPEFEYLGKYGTPEEVEKLVPKLVENIKDYWDDKTPRIYKELLDLF